MTRHDEQNWSDYTCPHCGENVWDTDYSHDTSYPEDDWFIEEVTCGCGAELTFSRRIADYPSYVSWDDTNCAPQETEEETERDSVARPPVDNSPIGQTRAALAQLQSSIVKFRTDRDFLINLQANALPARNSNRMHPALLEQWREQERQQIRLDYQEKIDECVSQMETLQAKLEQLEAEEVHEYAVSDKNLTMIYNKLMSGVPLL